jgi:hypothetical protein
MGEVMGFCVKVEKLGFDIKGLVVRYIDYKGFGLNWLY